jgi:hypothetical protein
MQTTYIGVFLVVNTVTCKIVVRASIFLIRFDGAFAEALGYVGNPALGRPSTKLASNALSKSMNSSPHKWRRVQRFMQTYRQLYFSHWPFASADVMLKVLSADTREKMERRATVENFMAVVIVRVG